MPLKQNIFLNAAMDRAARLAGKPGRLGKLLVQLAWKLKETKWQDLSANNFRDKFSLLGRMMNAHLRGHYRVKSMRILVSLLAAVIYFVNPFDLIPDVLLGVGLADDLAVLTWVYASAKEEVLAFSAWERMQTPA